MSRPFRSYPRSFWLMIAVSFIDQLGMSLLIPFFALYVSERFSIGMAQVGVLFAVYGAGSFLGGIPGGALTDRFGRKGIIIFGLAASSFSRAVMVFVGTYQAFLIVAFVAGLFADISRPVYDAMFMDILAEEQRTSGFGIRRVAYNLAIVGGPVIGGLVARQSYLVLFIASAVACSLAAMLVLIAAPETIPAREPNGDRASTRETLLGYRKVLVDAPFMAFVGTSLLAWLVYVNMSTTLGVYLRHQYGVPESFYGFLLSLNAAMVVLLQFSVARWAGKRPPLAMMALGSIIFSLGLGMYGIVSSNMLFILAMAAVTLGEMIALPVSTVIIALFAPQDMRGRYNSIFYNSWVFAYAVGPYVAGVILDSTKPNLLWIACAALGVISALFFLGLQSRVHFSTLPSTAE